VPIVRLTLAKGLIKANQKDAARKELEVLAQLGDKFPAHDEVAKLIDLTAIPDAQDQPK
jgi:hypothetical protein